MTSRRGRAGPYFLASTVVLLMSAGCVSGPSPNLYVLNTVTPRPSELPSRAKSRAVSAGINAVTIPEYLDRSEIVVRSSANELKTRESERWGESLAAGATRAFTENLARAL